MDMSVFTVNVLPTLIDTLKTGTDDAKDDALGQLAQIMDTSYGEDAEALCEFLRVAGCVALVAGLLGSARADIHQTAMLCAAIRPRAKKKNQARAAAEPAPR